MNDIKEIGKTDGVFITEHAKEELSYLEKNLDKLAKRGTSFVRAHIAGGTCGAVCMPSRAMILSGRNPFHLEELGGNIPPEHKTLAETFKNNGYETIGLGKWHNGCPAYARSFTQGAKIFFGGMWDHWNVPTCRYDPTGKYDNVINFVVDFYNDNHPQSQHCDEFDPGKHSSTLLTDSAIELLNKNAGGEKPFFMYLAYLAPHDPRTMPDEFRQMYDAEKITLPPNFQKIIDTNYPLMVHRDEHLAAYPREEDDGLQITRQCRIHTGYERDQQDQGHQGRCEKGQSRCIDGPDLIGHAVQQFLRNGDDLLVRSIG